MRTLQPEVGNIAGRAGEVAVVGPGGPGRYGEGTLAFTATGLMALTLIKVAPDQGQFIPIGPEAMGCVAMGAIELYEILPHRVGALPGHERFLRGTEPGQVDGARHVARPADGTLERDGAIPVEG